jgi:Galactose oxidase-like, Early set domain/Bacterial Ig domain
MKRVALRVRPILRRGRSGLLSRLGLTVMASIVVAALVARGAAAHGGFTTADGHAAEDAVVHTAAQERELDAYTRAVTEPDASAAAAAVAAAPQDVGQWGPVVSWPVVGVHVALLPNGKVLAYDSIGDNATETYPVQDHTRATVWDPATGTQTPVTVDTGFNIFCSGLAHLVDGRMFIAGGNKDQQLNGIVQTHLFDPATNLWSLGPNMAAGRWYPSVTPLSNGEMLITSGRVDTPEVRTLAGGLRALSSASLSLPLYPWMDVAPNGRAFYSGPDQTLRALNTTGTGSWQAFAQRDTINRDYGGHALFDIGKMLVAGGGPSTKDARIVDINGATPQVSPTAPMAFGRRQHNLTVLADGTVLATGGNSSGAGLVDLNAGVYAAEQWNPANGQWRTLAAMQITRQYHSTALLLPDGRVLSSGGGICGTCDQVGYLGKNAEIFSPPYLFQADGTLAPRPAIDAAPAATSYGASMEIATANPASISKVALVRLGAVTHSNNMEQRYIPLLFTAGATTLTAVAPADANVAPPGFYMLFIVDANGVPSVARMVSVQGDSPPSVTLTQPANGATFAAPATVNLTATASDADGTVTKVEFYNGAAKLGEDLTAPYNFTWSGVAAGTYTLTARAVDNLGGAGTSAASTITVTAGNTPPTASLTSPTDGATFAAPATVNLAATASDADGTVTKVEFFNDATKLGEDSSAPYSFTWSGVAAGTYTLTARATDNLGGVGTSAASTITVTAGNTPPTVNITSPADGAVFAWKPTITVTATASDADGSVAKVEFRDGTTVLGQDTSAPYSFTWRNVPVGSHALTALATDNAGAVTTSTAVGITVRPKR